MTHSLAVKSGSAAMSTVSGMLPNRATERAISENGLGLQSLGEN
jgi:hypothetical protein